MNFDHLIDDYMRARRRGGFSPQSEKSYRWSYGNFQAALEGQGVDPDLLSTWERSHIEAWQDGQLDRLKPQSRALSATAGWDCSNGQSVRSCPSSANSGDP